MVCSRLRKDAALWDLPPTQRQRGQRGPLPTYGKHRICLAKRAGQTRGWQQVECNQYGETVTKTIKTFLATYRPAGGLIRVVLVLEEHGWIPFFSLDPAASAQEILEAIEISFPEAGAVAFQAGFDAWREVVGATGIEPSIKVHEGGSGTN